MAHEVEDLEQRQRLEEEGDKNEELLREEMWYYTERAKEVTLQRYIGHCRLFERSLTIIWCYIHLLF